eukprot:NODE_4231_length_1918_cov_3.906198.p1 GENE.NODE_4231_length_1918_cov_3.906198~~NODE_4231_length_1918_cov_3.906198.p1  ORF type:complete len:244 (+),score=43.35 NODE_4231_length_1918_cov_3.906198:288-1019(+)
MVWRQQRAAQACVRPRNSTTLQQLPHDPPAAREIKLHGLGEITGWNGGFVQFEGDTTLDESTVICQRRGQQDIIRLSGFDELRGQTIGISGHGLVASGAARANHHLNIWHRLDRQMRHGPRSVSLGAVKSARFPPGYRPDVLGGDTVVSGAGAAVGPGPTARAAIGATAGTAIAPPNESSGSGLAKHGRGGQCSPERPLHAQAGGGGFGVDHTTALPIKLAQTSKVFRSIKVWDRRPGTMPRK